MIFGSVAEVPKGRYTAASSFGLSAVGRLCMDKRPRGERGGKSAQRKKRRESFWHFFQNFLAYFAYYSRPQHTWYTYQVKVVPKPRRRPPVTQEHIELPVRNTVSFRGLPASAEETTREVGSQYPEQEVQAEPVDLEVTAWKNIYVEEEPAAASESRPSGYNVYVHGPETARETRRSASSSEPVEVEAAEETGEEPLLSGYRAGVGEEVLLFTQNPDDLSEGIQEVSLKQIPLFRDIPGVLLVNTRAGLKLETIESQLKKAFILDIWQTVVIPDWWVRDDDRVSRSYLPETNREASFILLQTLRVIWTAAQKGFPVCFCSFIGRNNLAKYVKDLVQSAVPHLSLCTFVVTDKEDKARIAERLACTVFVDDNKQVCKHLRRRNIPYIQVHRGKRVGDPEFVFEVPTQIRYLRN